MSRFPRPQPAVSHVELRLEIEAIQRTLGDIQAHLEELDRMTCAARLLCLFEARLAKLEAAFEAPKESGP